MQYAWGPMTYGTRVYCPHIGILQLMFYTWPPYVRGFYTSPPWGFTWTPWGYIQTWGPLRVYTNMGPHEGIQWAPGANPSKTAVPFWGQNYSQIEWFVPKTGQQYSRVKKRQPGVQRLIFSPTLIWLRRVRFRVGPTTVELCFLTQFSYQYCPFRSEPILLNVVFVSCGRPLYTHETP